MSMQKIKNIRGFTLVELMIVVAIVAILVSLATASYQNSIRKGRRNDGQSVILEVAGRQEAFYARNATYTNDLDDLNINAASPDGYYTIAIPTADTTSYAITATATTQGGQNNDRVSVFRITSTGQRQYNDGAQWYDGWSGH